MINLRNSILVFTLIFMACGRNSQRARQEIRSGINGQAIYVYSKDNSIWQVIKPEYNGKDFQVFISNDTIVMGSKFTASINVPKPKFSIEIISPENSIIDSDGQYGPKDYTFVPKHTGIYNFYGLIKYDTTAFPFEYKFVVVDVK